MEDAQRWSVTYTKHVKQKRKVYQDGFLQLHSSGHKVMLYDESEKLLDSRFVKKDDIINFGETLAFDSYLVDIGELCEGHKTTFNLNWQEKDRKFAEKSGSLHRYDSEINSISVDKTPTFWKRKERVMKLSPSEKMIKDFKKTEMKKYGSSPTCSDMKKSSTTGKAPDKTSALKLTNLNNASYIVENARLSWRTPGNEPKRAVHDILSILRKPIQGKVVAMSTSSSAECLESHSSDVRSDIENQIKEYAEECSGSTREKLKERNSDHDGRINVLKPEAVEELVAAENCTVSENRRESRVGSSTFCLSSGTMNSIAPIFNVECTNHIKLASGSSSIEPHTLMTSELDSEGDRSAAPTRSKDILEPEKSPKTFSCEEIMTETKAVAINDLSSSKSTKVQEESKVSSSGCNEAASSVSAVASNDHKSLDPSGMEEQTSKQDFHTKEIDEFPSFDLGF